MMYVNGKLFNKFPKVLGDFGSLAYRGESKMNECECTEIMNEKFGTYCKWCRDNFIEVKEK